MSFEIICYIDDLENKHIIKQINGAYFLISNCIKKMENLTQISTNHYMTNYNVNSIDNCNHLISILYILFDRYYDNKYVRYSRYFTNMHIYYNNKLILDIFNICRRGSEDTYTKYYNIYYYPINHGFTNISDVYMWIQPYILINNEKFQFDKKTNTFYSTIILDRQNEQMNDIIITYIQTIYNIRQNQSMITLINDKNIHKTCIDLNNKEIGYEKELKYKEIEYEKQLKDNEIEY